MIHDNEDGYLSRRDMRGVTFRGPAGVQTFRAMALRQGLKLYAACGIKPNRAWTPSNMLRAAGSITGKQYKRGQYMLAADDLTTWIEANGTTGE